MLFVAVWNGWEVLKDFHHTRNTKFEC